MVIRVNCLRSTQVLTTWTKRAFIAERIQQWLEDGGSPSEAAILYRSNAQSRVLEEALLRLNIPYQIYGGQRFFERAEIKNALAYMRLMEDRHSDPAFERVVNTPPGHRRQNARKAIRQLAWTHQTSLWQAAKDGITGGAFTARVNGAVGHVHFADRPVSRCRCAFALG